MPHRWSDIRTTFRGPPCASQGVPSAYPPTIGPPRQEHAKTSTVATPPPTIWPTCSVVTGSPKWRRVRHTNMSPKGPLPTCFRSLHDHTAERREDTAGLSSGSLRTDPRRPCRRRCTSLRRRACRRGVCLQQGVHRHARAAHAVRVADRERAAVDVELLVRSTTTARANGGRVRPTRLVPHRRRRDDRQVRLHRDHRPGGKTSSRCFILRHSVSVEYCLRKTRSQARAQPVPAPRRRDPSRYLRWPQRNCAVVKCEGVHGARSSPERYGPLHSAAVVYAPVCPVVTCHDLTWSLSSK